MAERSVSAAPPPNGEWYALVSTPRPGSASLGKALKLTASVVVALIALNLYAPGAPTVLERAFASAILASLALPVWLWMSGADRTIPFMPFLTLVFAYYFALPVFLLRKFAVEMFKPPIPEHYITLALGYSLLGLYCLFAGYYGPAKWLFAPILPRFNLQWRDLRVVKMIGLMVAFGGLLVSSSNVLEFLPENLAQIGVFAADLSMIGICALVALQLAGKLDWITAAVVWGFLIPIRIAVGLGSGAAASGLIVGIAVVMMFASVRRTHSMEDDVARNGGAFHFAARRGAVPHGDLGRKDVECRRDREGARVRRNCLPHHDRRRRRSASADRNGKHAAGAIHNLRRSDRRHAGDGAVLARRVVISDPVQADSAFHHAGQARGIEWRMVRAPIWTDHDRQTRRPRSTCRR